MQSVTHRSLFVVRCSMVNVSSEYQAHCLENHLMFFLSRFFNLFPSFALAISRPIAFALSQNYREYALTAWRPLLMVFILSINWVCSCPIIWIIF